MDHWKKNQHWIVIPHTCFPFSPKMLMSDYHNCPQITALRNIPTASRHSFRYNLMGFSWLQVKVEKGRVKRCRWLIWRYERKKEDTNGKRHLLQSVRAEKHTYMIAFRPNSVGLGSFELISVISMPPFTQTALAFVCLCLQTGHLLFPPAAITCFLTLLLAISCLPHSYISFFISLHHFRETQKTFLISNSK